MRLDRTNALPLVAVEPPEGKLTWMAEGQPTGRFASKGIHWPGGNSGVTIGRGYDMGRRTRAAVIADLVGAGVAAKSAEILSAGAGLRGDAAATFVRQRKANSPELTAEQELKLFQDITYPRYRVEALRISSKADVVTSYGELDFDTMPEQQRELLIDLLYRGDYTPATRAVIQEPLVLGDKALICDALDVITEIKNVPQERAKARRIAINCPET